MRKYTVCQYRECEKQIPNELRRDAKYCCADHGWRERNYKKNDDTIWVETQKALKINYKIIKDLFERGKTKVSKEVLEALDFNFDVMTKLNNIKDGIIEYDIFEYMLTVNGDKCSIKKILI